MKKIRNIVCLIFALVALSVFSGVAFADNSANWSSTVCLYGFTTSHEIEKPSDTTWSYIEVTPTKIEWAGHPEWMTDDRYVLFYVKTSSGIRMSDQYEANMITGFFCDTFYEGTDSYSPVKLRIDNPHPGYNMVSQGHFVGFW